MAMRTRRVFSGPWTETLEERWLIMTVRIRGSSSTQRTFSGSQHEAHSSNSASVIGATASTSSMGMNQSVSFSALQT